MVYFAGYGFNKSHSAAYAYVAWQTAYLKAHYCAEFMAATMTSMISDVAKISYYAAECKRHHVPVLSPDVNESESVFPYRGAISVSGWQELRVWEKTPFGRFWRLVKKDGPFTSF